MIFSIFGNNNYAALSDEKLMLYIADGKGEAFNEIYHRYGDKLFKYFLKLLDSNKLAEDFTQDLFIKVMESADSFDHQKKFSSWLYCIANNMCRNEWRNSSNRAAILGQIKIEEPYNHQYNQHLDKKVLRNKLHEEIHKMDEEDRLMISMRYEQELSIKEISVIIDIPEGTVKSRLFYLMKKLNLKLKAYSPH